MSIESNKLMNLGDGKVLYDDLRGRIDDNNTLTKTISTPAAVQTFTDGAEWPVEMEIAIEPVQDLHGYDHPWPGGGGVNLLYIKGEAFQNNTGDIVTMASAARTEKIACTPGETFTAYVKTAIGGNGSIIARRFDSNESYIGNLSFIGPTDTGFVTKEIPSDTYFVGFSAYETVSGGNFKGDYMVARGTVTTYSPYENKCPITGWDGANIDVVGKNWLSFNSVSLNKDSKRTQTESISTIPAGTYIFSWEGSATYSTNFRFMNSSSIATVNVYGVEEKSVQVELTEDVNTLYMFISNNAPSGATCELTSMMLRLVSETDATYEAYQGAIYPVTFASTCYGGTLTVHADRTGTLVVDRKTYSITSFTNKSGSTANNAYYKAITGIKRVSGDTVANILSDKYVAKAYNSITAGNITDGIGVNDYGNVVIGFGLDGISTLNEANTWIAQHPVQIVYELATPLVYTLSVPQVMSIIDLNQIWADCGNINSISYVRRQDLGFIRDDTAGQIKAATDPIREELEDTESSLAIVIDGDKAPKAITSGQYLFIKNHSTLARGLYHATSAILSGASITSNNTSPDPDGVANAINANIPEVVDNLTTQDATKALSAAQGYSLNSKFAINELKSGSIPGGGDTVFEVTFGKTMISTPIVLANVYSYTSNESNVLFVMAVSDITSTGCKITVRNFSTSSISLSSNRRLVWIAMC